MTDLIDLSKLRDILLSSKTIAVVGLSPKENRPSNMVARYLLDAGYTIYPVNPGHDSILGLPCYPDLLSVPAKIDIVDIFRRSEETTAIVEQAVAIGARTIWMQEGITNNAAIPLAQANNMDLVMNRCIKIDHAALI